VSVKINSNNAFPVSFKKRKNTGYSLKKTSFGLSSLKLKKSFLLENIYLVFLKKKIKKFVKKKTKKAKVWFFLIENYPISRKGKNTRMGKGKGNYIRMVTRVKKNKILLEINNINTIFLKKIRLFFKKKTGLDLIVDFKKVKQVIFRKRNISFYNSYRRF